MSEGKVRLFHLTSPEAVENILKEGIKPSKTKCLVPLRDVQPPERDEAVFTYDEETLRRVARYGRPDDKVLEIEVDSEEVYVGDLRKECSQDYKETVMKIKEYMRGWKRYYEPEFFVSRRIKPEEIVGVIDRREFL